MRMRIFNRYKPAHICAALLVGLAAGLLLWRDMHRMQRQATQLEIESAHLSVLQQDAAKARRNAQELQKQNGGGPQPQDAAPAIALLQALEAAWTADISLLRLVSDLPNRRAQLQILARSNQALFDFIARLKQQVGADVLIERQADRSSDRAEWALDASVALGWQ